MNPKLSFSSPACLRDLVLVTHKKGTHETQKAQQLLKKIEGLVGRLHLATFLKATPWDQPPSALRVPLLSTRNAFCLKSLHTFWVNRSNIYRPETGYYSLNHLLSVVTIRTMKKALTRAVLL